MQRHQAVQNTNHPYTHAQREVGPMPTQRRTLPMPKGEMPNATQEEKNIFIWLGW